MAKRRVRIEGTRVGLPGYAWDKRLLRYVNVRTGRMVARASIKGLLTDVSMGIGDTMARLGQAAARGTLSPRQFYEAMQITLKHAYNANVAMAMGGWDQVTAAEWGRNGGYLRKQYEYLAKFVQEIAAGELSEAQIIARAEGYSTAAYSRYWEADAQVQIAAGMKEERRITVDDDDVCDECRGYEAQGWVPIGTLPNPGNDTHPHCRCEKEYH